MFNISDYWYKKSFRPLHFILLPLSKMFGAVSYARHFFYKQGLIKTKPLSATVIVVGNITVGGTGKTPFVMWLAQFLRSHGYKPGIVARGVGGKKKLKPFKVSKDSDPSCVGDEALMMAQNADCPVVISINRVAAALYLIEETGSDIIISDDGLQHYALRRDIEIIMVDGERRFGNKWLLPAGPLREPISRTKKCDYIIVKNGKNNNEHVMRTIMREFISIKNSATKIDVKNFSQRKVHAVVGIGHPENFLTALRNEGFELIPHIFKDHHAYQASDLVFNDTYPVIMTEKDAVKCKSFALENFWFAKLEVEINEEFKQNLLMKLKSIGENNGQISSHFYRNNFI